MDSRFRLGIIGVGKVTISAHLPAALSFPDIEVAALVDPVLERAQSIARDYGVKGLVTSNLEDVFGKIDGAIIATPNHLHADTACALLDANIPVLIEKPLAASREDGQRIVDAARRSGTTAGVGYCSRFQDNVLFMGKLIEEQYFGRIEKFAYQIGTRGGWAPFSAYNLNREQTGGGVVMVTGTHFLDRMLAWFGTPSQIRYYDDGEVGPESNAIIQADFDNANGPRSGLVHFSKTCPLKPGLVMDTDKGRVVLKDNDTDWPLLKPAGESGVEMELKPNEAARFAPELDGFQRQMQDFVEACRNNTQPMVSVEAGLASLDLIESMYATKLSLATEWYAQSAVEELKS